MHPTGYQSYEVRIQILTLWAYGVSTQEISTKMNVPLRTIQGIVKRAKERGYNPQADFRIRREYVEDGKRSGRPKNRLQPEERSGHEDVSGNDTDN
ncbi:hypothetical protein ASPBRDRAFT_46060 [Aspergillus brasiliensis CBS 101740]|uniref:Uncharacterized protein n=1 Tax=Aspergillus brasiliensis (strain CBS 101740 / IMI 381727 / IBT 21946) TaxID=767769 RepID=A0A1L9UDH6_ASPBC|nr:hypothetical protein ASPBRDRAFT_46060 [Aspergillus brasiliensis CBS 101740]